MSNIYLLSNENNANFHPNLDGSASFDYIDEDLMGKRQVWIKDFIVNNRGTWPIDAAEENTSEIAADFEIWSRFNSQAFRPEQHSLNFSDHDAILAAFWSHWKWEREFIMYYKQHGRVPDELFGGDVVVEEGSSGNKLNEVEDGGYMHGPSRLTVEKAGILGRATIGHNFNAESLSPGHFPLPATPRSAQPVAGPSIPKDSASTSRTTHAHPLAFSFSAFAFQGNTTSSTPSPSVSLTRPHPEARQNTHRSRVPQGVVFPPRRDPPTPPSTLHSNLRINPKSPNNIDDERIDSLNQPPSPSPSTDPAALTQTLLNSTTHRRDHTTLEMSKKRAFSGDSAQAVGKKPKHKSKKSRRHPPTPPSEELEPSTFLTDPKDEDTDMSEDVDKVVPDSQPPPPSSSSFRPINSGGLSSNPKLSAKAQGKQPIGKNSSIGQPTSGFVDTQALFDDVSQLFSSKAGRVKSQESKRDIPRQTQSSEHPAPTHKARKDAGKKVPAKRQSLESSAPTDNESASTYFMEGAPEPDPPTVNAGSSSMGLVTGKYDPEEQNRIEDFVRGFRKEHKLSSEEFNTLVQWKRGIRGVAEPNTFQQQQIDDFWPRLYEAFSNRDRTSIRKYCFRQFKNTLTKGGWTPEEDRRLCDLAEEYTSAGRKPDYMKIGALLDRTNEACRDRHRDYAPDDEQERPVGVWAIQDEERLINIVSKHATVPDDGPGSVYVDTKGKKGYFRLDVSWPDIAKELNTGRKRIHVLQKYQRISKRLLAEANGEARRGKKSKAHGPMEVNGKDATPFKSSEFVEDDDDNDDDDDDDDDS